MRGAGDLVVADKDGNNERVLTSSWNIGGYRWSPDGKWMAFSRLDDNYNRDIFIISVKDDAEPINISRHPY